MDRGNKYRAAFNENVPSEDTHNLCQALKWSLPALPACQERLPSLPPCNEPKATTELELRANAVNAGSINNLLKVIGGQIDLLSQTLARIPVCFESELSRVICELRQENEQLRKQRPLFQCGAPSHHWREDQEKLQAKARLLAAGHPRGIATPSSGIATPSLSRKGMDLLSAPDAAITRAAWPRAIAPQEVLWPLPVPEDVFWPPGSMPMPVLPPKREKNGPEPPSVSDAIERAVLPQSIEPPEVLWPPEGMPLPSASPKREKLSFGPLPTEDAMTAATSLQSADAGFVHSTSLQSVPSVITDMSNDHVRAGSVESLGQSSLGREASIRASCLSIEPTVFLHSHEKISILRDIWREDEKKVNLKDVRDIFTLKISKNTDTVVRPSVSGHHHLTRFRMGQDLKGKETQRRETTVNKGCILHPMSSIRLSWCFATLLAIIWDVLFIPMEAFPVPRLFFFFCIEWVITVFWTLDIGVTFRTGYMTGSKVEMSARKIAIKYLRTWLIPDLLIVAVEWVGRLVAATTQGSSLSRVTRVFRAVRSVRLVRLTKLQNLIHTVEDQVNSHALQLVFALIKMTALLVVLMHFSTCLWFWIGDVTHEGWVHYANVPPCGWTSTSDSESPSLEEEDFTVKEWVKWYVNSARWVAAQANGRVDQDARRNIVEQGFTCVAAVIGPMLCMSVFISQITTTMIELNKVAQSRRTVRLRLNQYLSGHQVSATLTARLKAYVRHHKDLSKQQEAENFILSILPNQLQHDLMYEVRAPSLVAHKFFDEINTSFPQSIKQVTMQAMTPILTHQDETIFETGDACNKMIFAYRGRFIYSQGDKETHSMCVRVHSHGHDAGQAAAASSDGHDEIQQQAQAATMRRYAQEVGTGVWLSEAAIWLEWQNQGMFTAVNDGLLYGLEADSFNNVMKSYLDVLSLVVAYALRFQAVLKTQTSFSDIIDMEFETKLGHHMKHATANRKRSLLSVKLGGLNLPLPGMARMTRMMSSS